jgi:hypothetical protein
MHTRRTFLKTSILLSSAFTFPKLALSAFENQKANVLLIGDSISIGYTPFVKELLKYQAEVSRPVKENGQAENCQGTTNGVVNIKRWVGDTKWDIIHFNFGLHDLKHVDPVTKGNSKNPKHPLRS